MAAVGLECGGVGHSLCVFGALFTGGHNVAFLVQGHSPPAADFLQRAQTADAHLGFLIDGADADARRRRQIVWIRIRCRI